MVRSALTILLIASSLIAQHRSVEIPPKGSSLWGRGIEGQRRADLGNGTFRNPIMAGDHPDPTILKDGDDYYMTFSSMENYPGLILWHSRDLVNWQPVGPALTQFVGTVWAADLIKYRGLYYIYFPARTGMYRSNYVITASDIRGPWSAPVDLHVPLIDPGHAVGEDGQRYLFFSGGNRIRLADDGLSTVGTVEHVYDGWQYPESWDVESYSLEGPKVLQHNGYYYLISAVGGSAGPPTGHMVIVARSRSINGPWENDPKNPVIRTLSRNEPWWSKGHATLVEGPDRAWYGVYHAYENGYWTLGRQTILEPIRWTNDGWWTTKVPDVSAPIPKPVRFDAPHGMALSDDFTTDKFGIQWNVYNSAGEESSRIRFEDGALVVRGKGSAPSDASPITCVTGDRSYRCQVRIDIDSNAQGGLLLFYSKRLYVGLGFNDRTLVMHRYGTERELPKPDQFRRTMYLRITNREQIVTIHYSMDGDQWTKFGTQMEVSGYHHNVAYDFLSLRPALYASGKGSVRFRDFRYEALH